MHTDFSSGGSWKRAKTLENASRAGSLVSNDSGTYSIIGSLSSSSFMETVSVDGFESYSKKSVEGFIHGMSTGRHTSSPAPAAFFAFCFNLRSWFLDFILPVVLAAIRPFVDTAGATVVIPRC